uniref:Uncharacterized protein n=1 Tax=Anguilla anguilla TaxID=7936 RepID=A0A0E9WC24_ANGAN
MHEQSAMYKLWVKLVWETTVSLQCYLFPFLYGNHLFLKTPEMQLEEMMHLSRNMIGLKGVFDCLKMCTSYHVKTDISLHRAIFLKLISII